MNEKLEQLIEMYSAAFYHGRINCAETVLITMCNYYDIDMDICPRIATAFGGGICGTQNVCGALSGALMVIGLRHGREIGGDRAPSYALGKRLMTWFEDNWGSSCCRELTGFDFSDAQKMAAFREPGGVHQSTCEPLVRQVCRWLGDNL